MPGTSKGQVENTMSATSRKHAGALKEAGDRSTSETMRTDHVNETSESKMLGDYRLSLKEKLSYAVGDTAQNIVFAICTSVLVFFYTDYIGISAGVIGTVIFISRIFDGVSDLVMGVICDKTNSKYGKARPWVLWMTLPFALSTVALFLIPAHASDWFKAVYIFVTYNLVTTVVYTAINLPYSAMAAMMTRNQHERGVTNALRMSLSPFGRIAATACAIPLVKLFGDDQRAWIIVSIIFAAVSTVLLLICFFNTRERVSIPAAQKQRLSVRASVGALFKNKYWALGMLLWGMLSIYGTLVGMDLTYYCKYILGDITYMSVISVAEWGTTILTVLSLPLLLKRVGKRNIALAGAIVAVIGGCILFIDPASYPLAVVSALVKGMGQGPLFGVIFSMIADAVEYGQWKTRIRQEGMIFSAASIGSKLGAGITSAVIGGVLAWAGYNGLLEEQSPVAISAISGMYLYGPVIVWGVTALLLWVYRLDSFYDKMMKDLNEREITGVL